eukprot:10047003-Prorocentrum_lima.AAC.1
MAVIVKNTLTIVGQHSPMQATLGYRPGLLPGIDQGDAHCDDEMFDGMHVAHIVYERLLFKK